MSKIKAAYEKKSRIRNTDYSSVGYSVEVELPTDETLSSEERKELMARLCRECREVVDQQFAEDPCRAEWLPVDEAPCPDEWLPVAPLPKHGQTHTGRKDGAILD